MRQNTDDEYAIRRYRDGPVATKRLTPGNRPRGGFRSDYGANDGWFNGEETSGKVLERPFARKSRRKHLIRFSCSAAFVIRTRPAHWIFPDALRVFRSLQWRPCCGWNAKKPVLTLQKRSVWITSNVFRMTFVSPPDRRGVVRPGWPAPTPVPSFIIHVQNRNSALSFPERPRSTRMPTRART